MVDFKRLWLHQPGGSTPRPGHYTAPPQNRYLEPVVAPLEAARRITNLEGWLEYERTTQ